MNIIFIVIIALTCNCVNQTKAQEENIESASAIQLNLTGPVRQQFALEALLLDPEINIVICPAAAVLLLTTLFLSSEAPSRRELKDVLGITDISTRKIRNELRTWNEELLKLPKTVNLKIATFIYVQKYVDVMGTFIANADLAGIDIEKKEFRQFPNGVSHDIDNKVARATENNVRKVLLPRDVSPFNSMLVVNANYFIGKWKIPFILHHSDKFKSIEGEQEVAMMSTANDFLYVNSGILDAQIVNIPYDSDQASLIVILPNDPKGLPQLLRNLKANPDSLNDALSEMVKTTLLVTLPKFTITSKLDLRVLFENLNLTSIFNPADKSGLRRVVYEPVTVTTAITKTVIDIRDYKEDSLDGDLDAILNVKLKFLANSPFMFIMRLESWQVFTGIFSGIVASYC